MFLFLTQQEQNLSNYPTNLSGCRGVMKSNKRKKKKRNPSKKKRNQKKKKKNHGDEVGDPKSYTALQQTLNSGTIVCFLATRTQKGLAFAQQASFRTTKGI